MNFPEDLLKSLQPVAGFDEENLLRAHLQESIPVSLRINPLKNISSTYFDIATLVPWARNGIYLSDRPAFARDPLWHAGAYYVQEASSMFVEQAFLAAKEEMHGPLRALDLCAAPGGKSTHLLSLLGEDDLLVSNEIMPARNAILRENLIKWGQANGIVTQNDPQDFGKNLPGYFDLILVDAPCSGSGLFRKDEEALAQWSEALVEHCALRQNRILEEVWPALKTGGILIYSTCSYSPLENEDCIGHFMSSHDSDSVPLNIPADWGITEVREKAFSGYRFYPDKVKGEGFFLAVLRKNEASENDSTERSQQFQLPKKMESFWRKFKPSGSNWLPYINGETLYGMPPQVLRAFEHLYGKTRIKKAGVEMGKIIRDDLQPAHDWAVSLHPPEGLRQTDLDLTAARMYLKKEVFEAPFPSKGWNLLSFRGVPLGLAKNMGNRWNNYYPVAWRLRS